MKSRATIEGLESRRLLSGLPDTGHVTIDIDKAVATLTWDANGNSILTIVSQGVAKNYNLPRMTGTGALYVSGAEQADQISISEVQGIDSTTLNGSFREMLYTDPTSDTIGSIQSDFSPENLQRLKDDFANKRPDQLVRERRIVALIESGDLTRVSLDGVYQIFAERSLITQTIRIDGGAGSDTISVATNLPFKTTISGGSGADKITTGSRRTIVYGGGGNDMLISRSRHGGTLDGGKGADRYYDRFGEIQIAARNDGDRLVVSGSPVTISQSGVFGISVADGKSYFLIEGPGGQVDLLG